MGLFPDNLKAFVAAACLTLVASAGWGNDKLEQLYAQLALAEPSEAERIAAEIEFIWSRSGSASADLLLKRGRDAMEIGEFDAAIDHFSALVDHAPDFAEGWTSRASVFAHLGYFGLAVSDLEHALALNPKHFEAIFGLGTILERIERPKEAYEAYQMLQAIHPHHPQLTQALERVTPGVFGQSL